MDTVKWPARASDFLAELGRNDIQVWAEGDRLRCNAPAGALTAELRDQLRDRKADLLEFLQTAASAARQQPAVVPLQTRGNRTPAYGIPGHPGDVFAFADLVKHLGNDYPFYGMQPPGLDGKSEPLESVEAIAAYHVDQIQAFQPKGPYIIVGYCGGGAMAYHMTKLLVERGATVSVLAMFGTPYPATLKALPTFLFNVKYWTGRVFLHLREIWKMSSFKERRQYLADRFRARVAQIRKDNEPLPDDPMLKMRAKLSHTTIRAVSRYVPLPGFAGRVCLIVPNKAWLRSGTSPLKWLKAVPDAEVYFGPDSVDGPHMLMDPDAPAFAELFKTHCANELAPHTPVRNSTP